MRIPLTLLLLIALTLSACTVLAQGSAASSHNRSEQPAERQIKFTDYRLSNGLRVLLAPDERESGVAINITFDAGSRNERPGHTGLANLLEHIMMQNLQSDAQDGRTPATSETNGVFEGTINQERASYFASFPATQLDSVLLSLARSMRSLVINQVILDKQRALMREERKQSNNMPYSAMEEALLDLSYSNFAYRHNSIGSSSDLDNLTLDLVRSFFKTYYAPNNAVISIVGNFDEGRAKKIVESYFREIPRRPAPPRVNTSQAMFMSERRETVSDLHANFPFYWTGYLTVPSNHRDWYALNLLADILGQGDAARLYVSLVKKNLALSVPEGVNEARAPVLLRIGAKLPAGGSIETVEAIIDSEIARIQSEGVTKVEMETARSQERQYSLEQLHSAPGRANFLSRAAVYYNDPNRINTELGRMLAVTAEDVRRVARKYLIKTNRAVVIIQPAASR